MSEQKSLLLEIAEAVVCNLQRRAHQDHSALPAGHHPGWRCWLGRHMVPNVGTLLAVVVLLLTVPSLAAPLRAPAATSTSTISYQGRLADSSGDPLTGKYNLEFRIYDVPTGGVPLWTEMWTGANAVDVSDGLFNVMLGSIDNTLASAIEGYDELYLGITVETDSEMVPRVQLGSVPFSMQAMTVPDGSITTEKLATNAVTTTHMLDGAVTQAKLSPDIRVAKLIQNGIVLSGTGAGNTREVEVTFPEPFPGPPSVVATSDDLVMVFVKTFVNIRSVKSSGFKIRWYKRDGSDFSGDDPSVTAYWIAVER